MSYTDTLLATGERIIRRERQHWFVLVYGSRWAIAALVGGIVVLALGNSLGTDGAIGAIRNVVGYAALALLVGGLAWILWTYIRWINEEYAITNRRVIQSEGVMNKHASDSSLEKINDAAIDQSMFGRMFGFGDLDILTASESGIERIKMLDDPIDFKRSMLDAKHELELELARPSMPSPAMRASPPEGARSPEAGPAASPAPASPAPASSPPPAAPVVTPAAAAAPPPPAPAGPPVMAPDIVTRTLADLADLRDRGAITPEEFEAKKADLLARL